MLKDYTKDKFQTFDLTKQLKIMLDLAYFIEDQNSDLSSKHFYKLEKYHKYLSENEDELSIALNKEFKKINFKKKQWQIYITLLERLSGKSRKEYEFLISEGDKDNEGVSNPIIVLVDGVRSLHNIGAILRNCECFGVERVYVKSLGVEFDFDKVAKTSMGTHEDIEMTYIDDTLELVNSYRKKNYKIISLDTANKATNLHSYNEVECNGYLLILGHEQFGIDIDLLESSDTILKIPMYGKKNSLNVAVASGIALNKLVENCSMMTR